MRWQIAVDDPEIGQPAGQQFEMMGLFRGDADPVVEERTRQFRGGEPGDDIPAEIDRVELDMGEGVKERDPPRRRAERAALWHRLGWTQHRTVRPDGARWRARSADGGPTLPPRRGERPARRRFGRRIGGGEDRRRAGRKAGRFGSRVAFWSTRSKYIVHA